MRPVKVMQRAVCMLHAICKALMYVYMCVNMKERGTDRGEDQLLPLYVNWSGHSGSLGSVSEARGRNRCLLAWLWLISSGFQPETLRGRIPIIASEMWDTTCQRAVKVLSCVRERVARDDREEMACAQVNTHARFRACKYLHAACGED